MKPSFDDATASPIKSCLYGVYGASGFGREVMPLARQQVIQAGHPVDSLIFIDDAPSASSINGHRVLTREEFLSLKSATRKVSVAIADGPIRERLTGLLQQQGVEMWEVRADNAVKLDAIEVGPGAIICPFVTLTSNIRIGRSFHANIYSYVAHDCIIGDYVTFAPGVMCNGNVVVEDFAYIGTGAVIKQGAPGKPTVIGRGAVIGMGAVVTKSVPPGVTVVGNPARPLERP